MSQRESRVVVITGASSGIGRALALELARRGDRLALLARREAELGETADRCAGAGAEVLAVPCDVTIRAEFEAAIERTVERFGRIDVLVNNAGRGHNASIDATPDEHLESMFRVNVFSLWYGTAAALRHMRRQRSGLIANIASIAGKLGYPGNAAYVAAKHAVVGFTRALRTELVGSGVEAMTVIPAGVVTDWAAVAEGGSLLEAFQHERTRGQEIARDRGLTPATPFPVLSADEVAGRIADALEAPVPEYYTHPGTREAVLAAEQNPLEHERGQLPFWLAAAELHGRT